jgi:DNA processing protein
MGWQNTPVASKKTEEVITPMALTETENSIFSTLRNKGRMHFDQLLVDLQITSHDLNSNLFNLEMEGIVKSLPGRVYSI